MARVVNCPKCKEQGSLQPKKTKHGTYWRVAHYIGLKGETRKVKWCYIGKELPESITSQLITHDYPNITQYRSNPERLNLGSINQDSKGKQSRGSLAWLWRQTHDLESKSPKKGAQKSRARLPPPAPNFKHNHFWTFASSGLNRLGEFFCPVAYGV
jgi:hypothetical protein